MINNMHKIYPLRTVDVDDLILCVLFLEGKSREEIVRQLNITSPAVSRRFTKLEDSFGELFHKESGRRVGVNARGIRVFSLFRRALKVLCKYEDWNDI